MRIKYEQAFRWLGRGGKRKHLQQVQTKTLFSSELYSGKKCVWKYATVNLSPMLVCACACMVQVYVCVLVCMLAIVNAEHSPPDVL